MTTHRTVTPLRILDEPASGQRVRLTPGTCLELRFERRGLTQWHVEDHPGNLVPLADGGLELRFLAFNPGRPQVLRLVRSSADRRTNREVRELRVLVAPPDRAA